MIKARVEGIFLQKKKKKKKKIEGHIRKRNGPRKIGGEGKWVAWDVVRILLLECVR